MQFFIPPEDVIVEPPKEASFVTRVWSANKRLMFSCLSNNSPKPLCLLSQK